MPDLFERSLIIHEQLRGKIGLHSKMPVNSRDDLSLAYTPLWGENMTAGRGWIALALVVFATWRPLRLVAGAYLFAMVTQLQFYGQDWGLPIASQFLAMAPYLATIVALVIISRNVNLTKANAPACIGQPFRAER